MEGRTRDWVPIKPGPEGRYLVRNRKGDGFQWVSAEEPHTLWWVLLGLFLGFGLGTLLMWMLNSLPR